jgi:hypothetical protein
VSVKPVPSTYGLPFTVICTTDPGSLPLGAADGDATTAVLGDGDAPANVEPHAPRTRIAANPMDLTPLWSCPLDRSA